MIKKIKCLFVGTLIMFTMPAGVLADELGVTSVVSAEVSLYDDVTVQTTASVNVSSEDESEEEESVEVVEEEDTTESEESESEVEETESELSEDDREDKKPKKELREGKPENMDDNSSKFENEIRTEFMFTSLANRIELQVESAKVISDKAFELEKDVDFSEIILAMNYLAIEAQEYQIDAEISAEIRKEDFEAIKVKAKDLTKEFKDLTKDLFTEEEKASIKIELKAVKKSNDEKHKIQVQTMVNSIQLESAKKMIDRMGVDGAEVLLKIESGEISAEQIKEELKNLYKSINEEERKEVIQKYKEESVKKKIEFKEKFDEIKTQIEERREDAKVEFELTRENIKVNIDVQKKELLELKKSDAEAYELKKAELRLLVEAKMTESKENREDNKEVTKEDMDELKKLKEEKLKEIQRIRNEKLAEVEE
jgi:hypothetical protein